MNILVIGSNGMAGHVITTFLKNKNHSVHTAARKNADLIIDIENSTSVKLIADVVNFYQYDFVVNCVGLLVQDSISRPDRAIYINSWFPHHLEKILNEKHTKLIHLSTDCVFDGKKGNYVENDIHTETNLYGRSKSLGEIKNNKDITFRMSIIGPEIKSNGTGLLNWVLTSTEQTLPGWTNAWWNGITTLELAKCIDIYINNPSISGIYHLVNNENNINKFDLLCKINEVFNLGKTINQITGPKDINKILIDTRKEINFNIPNYDQQLKELYSFRETFLMAT